MEATAERYCEPECSLRNADGDRMQPRCCNRPSPCEKFPAHPDADLQLQNWQLGSFVLDSRGAMRNGEVAFNPFQNSRLNLVEFANKKMLGSLDPHYFCRRGCGGHRCSHHCFGSERILGAADEQLGLRACCQESILVIASLCGHG